MKKKRDNKKDYDNKIAKIPICRKCSIILTDKNWYSSDKKGYSYICKECKTKYNKEWQQKNKDKKSNKNMILHIPTCRECGIELTDKNWYASFRKRHSHICKKCKYKYAKKWRQNNRDKCNQLNRKSDQRRRDEVIDAYGGKCTCCGETRREYLTIDHINGDGRKQKREIGLLSSDSRGLYRWLRQNNYPEGFQVLCFNCNCGKGNYSVCPHNKEIFEKEFEAKHKTSSSKSVWKLRLNVIKGYGSKCELCGEENPHFLTIDHINREGSEERKILGNPVNLYRKLRDENYPRDNYRLLCYNCNCALGFNRIAEEEILRYNTTK